MFRRSRLAVALPSLALALGIGVALGDALNADASAEAVVAQATDGPLRTGSEEGAFLRRYCISCHNTKLKTAGLALNGVDLGDVGKDGDLWEKVLRKLHARAMPPVGRPRPDEAAYSKFATWLESQLDEAAERRPNPGNSGTYHRLNRTEYQNAIKDLLSLEIDAASMLPADDAAHGFDNIADLLTVSPLLLDRYLTAANRISRLAIGDSSLGDESYSTSKYLLQEERMSDDLPFASRGGIAVRHHFPVDGEYVIKIRFDGVADPPQSVDVRVDGVRVAQLLTRGRGVGALPDVGAVEARFAAKAGSRVLGVHLVKKLLAVEGRYPAYLPWGNAAASAGTNVGATRYLRVDTVEVSSPIKASGTTDTPSRKRIFICHPRGREDEPECARQIVSSLARKAYRRPATEPDVQTLLQFYADGRESDLGFEGGIRRALERLLSDPDFLFRREREPVGVPAGMPSRLSGTELASRLSFFLWSSIPDDELLRVAENGQLDYAEAFDRQVRRMLADERSRSLVSSFGAQWLYLRNLRIATPDAFEFPDWDDNLRAAFVRETELFLESQLREDRSVVDLLNADYTFVNDRLARHYGIPNVYGSHFRRVTVPDRGRTGLLGHGSVLTVTSYANRTSPVVRGKWLLENILGAAPPPPPPNVPDLPENETREEPKSIRARMEQHRSNPVCASCHATMDPLGFALENYDAIGRRREAESGIPIDATGALPDGTVIDGPVGLRQLLFERREQFVRAFTEKLLTYALGRGLEYYDMPVVRRVVRDAAAADYRWSAIIHGITRSAPFQMRIRKSEQ